MQPGDAELLRGLPAVLAPRPEPLPVAAQRAIVRLAESGHLWVRVDFRDGYPVVTLIRSSLADDALAALAALAAA